MGAAVSARAFLGWVKMRRFRKLGLAGLVALVLAGVSAHAALRAIVDQRSKAALAASAPRGYEVEDHFPGAAYFYAEDQQHAALAPSGATGTTNLPDVPLPAEATALAADTSVHPAAPFSIEGASATDRARALQCLTTAIYYEAATEPDAGQQAVAQVILNRVRHPAFPATVCGVVYQGSERAGCQFSFACDGSMDRSSPSRAYWARAARVAAAALGGHVSGSVGLATHYHTYAVTPAWDRHLVLTAALGVHFFQRWQGGWGTPAAFRQVYRGGEPVPGPHARIVAPVPVPSVATPVPPMPGSTPAAIPASVRETAVAPTPAADTLPGDAQILDRWKDSGKSLR